MGRLRIAVDGVGAHQPFPGIYRIMATVRCALRAVRCQPRRTGVQPDVGRTIPRLGMAHSIPVEPHPRGRGPLYPAGYSGNARFRKTACRTPDRARTDSRSYQTSAAPDFAIGVRAHGRASSVLYLHSLHLLLWDWNAARFARLPADRSAGRVGGLVLLDSVLRISVRPHRAEGHVYDRCVGDRRVRLHLFRHVEHRCGVDHLLRHRAVADPARYDVRSASCPDCGKLYRAPAL